MKLHEAQGGGQGLSWHTETSQDTKASAREHLICDAAFVKSVAFLHCSEDPCTRVQDVQISLEHIQTGEVHLP